MLIFFRNACLRVKNKKKRKLFKKTMNHNKDNPTLLKIKVKILLFTEIFQSLVNYKI